MNNPKVVPDPGLCDPGPRLTSNLSDLPDPAACLLVSSCWPWAWGTTWALVVSSDWPEPSPLSPGPVTGSLESGPHRGPTAVNQPPLWR